MAKSEPLIMSMNGGEMLAGVRISRGRRGRVTVKAKELLTQFKLRLVSRRFEHSFPGWIALLYEESPQRVSTRGFLNGQQFLVIATEHRLILDDDEFAEISRPQLLLML